MISACEYRGEEWTPQKIHIFVVHPNMNALYVDFCVITSNGSTLDTVYVFFAYII